VEGERDGRGVLEEIHTPTQSQIQAEYTKVEYASKMGGVRGGEGEGGRRKGLHGWVGGRRVVGGRRRGDGQVVIVRDSEQELLLLRQLLLGLSLSLSLFRSLLSLSLSLSLARSLSHALSRINLLRQLLLGLSLSLASLSLALSLSLSFSRSLFLPYTQAHTSRSTRPPGG
jgi:hypothetical protein